VLSERCKGEVSKKKGGRNKAPRRPKELMADLTLAVNGQQVFKIEPLK
jgi:hypothetical protein